MKRQRGRNNGRKPHPHMPVRSQTFDSSGPDVRIRGNAYQVLEKYLALARDATAAGDRVAAENFYQHAEHYYRMISAGDGHQRHGQGQGHDPRAQQQNYGQQGGYQGNGDPNNHAQQPHVMDPGSGPQPLTQPVGPPLSPTEPHSN
jgi:Domain of unknown function (DUF4167)